MLKGKRREMQEQKKMMMREEIKDKGKKRHARKRRV
jgi:hypothetical protein